MNNNRNTLIGLIIALLLIVGIGFGVYSITNQNKTTTAEVKGASDSNTSQSTNPNES